MSTEPQPRTDIRVGGGSFDRSTARVFRTVRQGYTATGIHSLRQSGPMRPEGALHRASGSNLPAPDTLIVTRNSRKVVQTGNFYRFCPTRTALQTLPRSSSLQNVKFD